MTSAQLLAISDKNQSRAEMADTALRAKLEKQFARILKSNGGVFTLPGSFRVTPEGDKKEISIHTLSNVAFPGGALISETWKHFSLSAFSTRDLCKVLANLERKLAEEKQARISKRAEIKFARAKAKQARVSARFGLGRDYRSV